MLNQNLIENEIEHIEILFLKEHYNNYQKKWFIESKKKDAEKLNDINLLEVCNKLLEKIT